jgi:LemA protein
MYIVNLKEEVMENLIWIILAIIIMLALFLWAAYNSLVILRVRVDEAWSDITVQLKRRLDLIPNLVETVKGYATYEKSVLEAVTEARANALNAKGVKETAKSENQFEGALKSLFAVAEAYPDLKANQSFIELQQELVDTEDKIQASRRFYNGGVRDLNTKMQIFPSSIVGKMFGFKGRDFYELDDAEQKQAEKPVDVKF